MRIRTIKPEFWTDKRVASWDYFTRLLFVGLWSASDDHGRGSAEPARIAADLFPYDLSRDPRETLARVSTSLARLSIEGRVSLYRVSDEVFFQVENWKKHQRVDNPGKSRIPAISEGIPVDSRESRETLSRPSPLDQGSGIRDQGPMEQGAGGAGGVDESACSAGNLVGGASPTSKVPRTPKLTDAEWLLQLSADPTYDGIDVTREHGKMIRWCQLHQKHPTRRRFLNWLNRAERPMSGKASNDQHPNDRNLSGGDLWDSTAPGGEDDVPFHGDEPTGPEPESPGLAPE